MKASTSRSGWPPAAVLWSIALVLLAGTLSAQEADPVQVSIDIAGDAVPGGLITATADITIMDGSVLQSITWMQTGGAEGSLSGVSSNPVNLSLGPRSAYKDFLFHVVTEPPIQQKDLPPNVPLPEGEFVGGLQNRFTVVGLNPFSLEEAGLVVLQAEVVTSSGTYHGEAEIHTLLPWKRTTGLFNVPVGIPVLLHGKDQEAYDWTLMRPVGSSAALMDAAMQNPEFIPDVPGLYQVKVTDEASGNSRMLHIYAGTWRGVIQGQDNNGRPVASNACTGCHGSFAENVFEPWKETGHAEIFTNNLNTNSHYSTACFDCHTVGYDPEVDNGGVDEAVDFQDFLDSGLLSSPSPNNWTAVLDQFPATAQLANAQCENCHGPQLDSDAHRPRGPEGTPRVSLSADVCATCHGEPLRHARFQQWQLSRHSNYELAIDEGESGSCSRCHTANGFLTWLPILLGEKAGDPLDDITVTWTAEETHPQTCQTCHDPHAIGTTSGSNSNATVRISDNTPQLIAGFRATDVGRGAICMTCHNSRRGLHNDDNFTEIFRTSEVTRAPHGSAQTDVLMGQNAYFVETGRRGSHSTLDDTCVTCHMERTPPPEVLSYNLGGTNHTFFASKTICADCHTNLTADGIQGVVQASLDDVKRFIETAYMDLFEDQTAMGNSIDLNGRATVSGTGEVAGVAFTESRGRQALIVTLAGGSQVGPLGLNSINVVSPMGARTGLYDVANPNLLKAGWNWHLINSDSSKGVHNFPFATAALLGAREALLSGDEPCIDDHDTMCLANERFEVEVNWRNFQGQTGSGQVVPFGSPDSGLFYFFAADNWEMLMKVLNGCGINDHYWVFFAATTNVEFEVQVRDSRTGEVKVYDNALGHPANAITDTSAFATCP